MTPLTIDLFYHVTGGTKKKKYISIKISGSFREPTANIGKHPSSETTNKNINSKPDAYIPSTVPWLREIGLHGNGKPKKTPTGHIFHNDSF